MKRRAFTIGLFVIAFCIAIIIAMTARAQRRNTLQSQPLPVADYTVSGPYTHKNLTIFLLHSADQQQVRAPLTLQEAMKRKLVVVRETGDVNRLTIQNRSNQDVFVQAGDIVKGGQQDRVLALDLIVPPKSGRIPIDAFCVEQGRWSRRGNEAVTAFSASDNGLASKDLKIAANARRSQSEVWANVSKTQEKLAMNAMKMIVTPSATPAPGRARRSAGSATAGSSGSLRVGGGVMTGSGSIEGLTSVTDRASPSSLQLTLENKLVKDTANDFVKNLSSIINGKRDVI